LGKNEVENGVFLGIRLQERELGSEESGFSRDFEGFSSIHAQETKDMRLPKSRKYQSYGI
jgi:hypothetical protein